MSYVEIEGEVYWRVDDRLPQWKEMGDLSYNEPILESDTQKRLDIPHMITQNWEEAEKGKLEMEEL